MCNRRIIEYGMIVGKKNGQDFYKEIEKKVSSGWEPFGNLCITDTQIVQVIVRYEDSKPKRKRK